VRQWSLKHRRLVFAISLAEFIALAAIFYLGLQAIDRLVGPTIAPIVTAGAIALPVIAAILYSRSRRK
jgi:uncharacterized membrane protein